jgi:hypothetical protein
MQARPHAIASVHYAMLYNAVLWCRPFSAAAPR